ncbi:MAG: hypothetical protein AAF413_03510 [Patescibacteria group bacterium]
MDEKEPSQTAADEPKESIYPDATRGFLSQEPTPDYTKRAKAAGKNRSFPFWIMIVSAVMIILYMFWILGGANLVLLNEVDVTPVNETREVYEDAAEQLN